MTRAKQPQPSDRHSTICAICAICGFTAFAAGPVVAQSGGGRIRPADAARVTGPSEPLQLAVAGTGATAVMKLAPMYSYPGGTYNTAGCYDDNNISGTTLTLLGGPCRTYWNLFIENWDPEDDGPKLRNFQARPNEFLGYQSGSGGPLTRANDVVCTSTGQCATEFGESGPICPAGPDPRFCNYQWFNKSASRTDKFRSEFPPPMCDEPVTDVGFVSPLGPLFFGSAPPEPCGLSDPHEPVYGGSLALNVPANAAGTYTIPFLENETFITNPDSVLLPLAARQPGVLVIATGSCCYDIGGPAPGCVDGAMAAECESQSGNVQFAPGGTCADPPTAAGCCECLLDNHCRDDDACTFSVCENCQCVHLPRPIWDPATQCCNATNGAVCTLAPSNACSLSFCSDGDGRGTCLATTIPAGEPCAGEGDRNPCTYDDTCHGLGTAESCRGIHVDNAVVLCALDDDCTAATGQPGFACDAGRCVCVLPDPIPTVSEWGLLILTLLLFTLGKLYFGRAQSLVSCDSGGTPQ